MNKVILLEEKLLKISENVRRIVAINRDRCYVRINDVLALLIREGELLVPPRFVKVNGDGALCWLHEPVSLGYVEKRTDIKIFNGRVVIPATGLIPSRNDLSVMVGLGSQSKQFLYVEYSTYRNYPPRRGQKVYVPQIQGNLQDIDGSWQLPGPIEIYYANGRIHTPYATIHPDDLVRFLCTYRRGSVLALLRQLEGCEVSPDGDTYNVIMKGGYEYFSVKGLERNGFNDSFKNPDIASTNTLLRALVTLIGQGYSINIHSWLSSTEPDPGTELIRDPERWLRDDEDEFT